MKTALWLMWISGILASLLGAFLVLGMLTWTCCGQSFMGSSGPWAEKLFVLIFAASPAILGGIILFFAWKGTTNPNDEPA
jgi:hypothetical protein